MTPDEPPAMLRPGETCWRMARADRLAVIVDAADYFAIVREAAQQATHSLLMIGWDFDTRIQLARPDRQSDVPNRLGRFLSWVVENRPGLQVHILRWDLGTLKELGRGTTPLVILDWMSHERIHFRLDSAHPVGAAHHQKIIVIDDALAFCGGIDMTADRWDTRDHRDDDPVRRRPTTKRRYGPWHDVSTAVDGEAARALGDLARERWRLATGETIQPPLPTRSAWPSGLVPSLRDVDVAIARTAPEDGERKGIHEIEALYLAGIRHAARSIYIESQYFASRKIAEAMAERLWEPDGPEIVVVNPESADGWLEEEVMGSSRARVLRLIREGDRHDRFRIYTPVTAGRQPIYVHAKVMVVDDWLLKVGSSNLNNRSLGFDTECDLAVEAPRQAAEGAEVRAAILALRNDLIAEHLGETPARVVEAIGQSSGSLVAAIELLRTDRRSLVTFEPPALNEVEERVLGESAMLDPERPASRWHALRRHLPGLRRRAAGSADPSGG